MKTINQRLSVLTLIFACIFSNAQTEGVSIKNTPSAPHSSAMLDVESSTKGVLIPRVYLSAVTNPSPVASPTLGLLVFNTNTTTLETGFYYWEVAPLGHWEKVNSGGLWSKYLSTTHIYNTNGVSGKVAIGVHTTSPVYNFEVRTDTSSHNTLLQSRNMQLRWGSRDFNGETGGGEVNILVQKTSSVVGTGTCTNDYYPMRFVQLYTTGDYGFGLTSYGKCNNQTGWTVLETSKNDMTLKTNTGGLVIEGKASLTAIAGPVSYVLQTGGWIPGSDSTLKKEIRNEVSVLDKLLSCRPVTYKFKSDPRGEIIHGLIAQEIELVFPEFVSNINIPDRDVNGNTLQTSTTKKGVAYSAMTSVLIKAIQEQQAIIEGLKVRIEALETR